SSSMLTGSDKIEKAIDLAKFHIMIAVREEMQLLKEQIRYLEEGNAMLEQENHLLRGLASPEQLAHCPPRGSPDLSSPHP
ncbi:TSC22 domain family protein 4-like, partial [Heterocephalus glaber]|uniref:TSC22 domain family protein 4-like n=1 Tax=Heterocephalus glaber TaxID=10181 RepID=A0AAX6QKA7_HETGA